MKPTPATERRKVRVRQRRRPDLSIPAETTTAELIDEGDDLDTYLKPFLREASKLEHQWAELGLPKKRIAPFLREVRKIERLAGRAA